ncbi:MAG TPA: U32 family peptidase [Candidatus Aphodoplasma excrementigallinarum]|uniref:U32 family peptidase n=1 Tax=Candidatus Aphodoplasma excrementigallinarum TaxID=2840673 RepID=A0A9D1T0B9_9FIRM|nr:U32 family peptidase [Candidatus Aphodoplasma excrementigallinarum]
MNTIELLAPAGDLTKLKMAILYGADAVYIGGEAFGLRTASKNFSLPQMEEGIRFAHERGKKVYLTTNIIPHNADLEGFCAYLDAVVSLGIDAVIVADLGLFTLIHERHPDLHIHISTQANNTNYLSAKAWYNMGAQRVVLARELSLAEIRQIRDNTPPELEIEAFVHGAMCISYSGRCLLSNYLTGRDANKGECAQPCRWNYALVEEKRPGEYIHVGEDEQGSFFFNSKDLCMIDHIPELVQSGITSFKIEGRVKSEYYVATVVKAYREEIDRYLSDPAHYQFDPESLNEVLKVSHRPYTHGFYFGKTDANAQVYETSSYIRDYDIVGFVTAYDEATGIATVEQRNKFSVGDTVEVIQPGKPYFSQKVAWLKNEAGEAITSTPHAQMVFTMPLDKPAAPNAMLRKGALVSGK